jgi:pimeloyl-ACP methyl ester carboxylesterase
MWLRSFVQPFFYALALAGAAAITLGAMLAVPLKRPPPMASIHQSALQIDETGAPDLSRFQARDGSWLAFRLYPAADGAKDRVAIVTHGSSASSNEMNAASKALAAAGVTAVAIDARGHGASAGRGDIGYIGQMEDDLADLLDHLRADYPNAQFQLIGHSLGGGFAARIAGTPVGRRFERFMLLAPFLGVDAPSSGVGNQRWASADTYRIIALVILRKIGLTFGQSLPVIAYATDPAAAKVVTSRYSFRLLADYGPDFDWAKTQATIRSAAPKMTVICGADDELMNAPAFESELKPLGAEVKLLPGVDHMGVVYQPAALAALVETVKAP